MDFNMEVPKKIIIAVDGYSSTGKSTLAKRLAKKLGYVYVDTGAMYRAVSLYAMQNGYVSKETFDKAGLISNLDHIDLQFKFNSKLGFSEIFLNGKNVENDIRSLEVSNVVSKVAAVSEVRVKLVEQQHKMGMNKGIVMDGRDIGTVVFPDDIAFGFTDIPSRSMPSNGFRSNSSPLLLFSAFSGEALFIFLGETHISSRFNPSKGSILSAE